MKMESGIGNDRQSSIRARALGTGLVLSFFHFARPVTQTLYLL